MWSEARGWWRPWGRAWSGQPSSFGAVESPSCSCAVPKCNSAHRSTHFPLPESKALQKPPQRGLGALCCCVQSVWKCEMLQCLLLSVTITVSVASSFSLLRQEWFTPEHSVHPLVPRKGLSVEWLLFPYCMTLKWWLLAAREAAWKQWRPPGYTWALPMMGLASHSSAGWLTRLQLCRINKSQL